MNIIKKDLFLSGIGHLLNRVAWLVVLIFILALFIPAQVSAMNFQVTKDGEVGAYFVGSSAEYDNSASIRFDSFPLEVLPSINNHSSSFGDYTSFGVRDAGDGVNFFDFVTDNSGTNFDLWSNDATKNYDGQDHFYYSAFTLPDGTSALFVGWEDVRGLGDKDFNDTMMIFTNITPVPEPETYLMLLIGLALVGFMSKRKSV